MLHLVRFITWLLLFLPLSNQIAVSNEKIEKELADRVPRYYQRTILHGLMQSQVTTDEIIDPKTVYAFLKNSGAVLSNRISEKTFQEIYGKLKDSLINPLVDPRRSIDLSEYAESKDQSKQNYAKEMGKGVSQIAYRTLVKHLVTLYTKYCCLKNTSSLIPSWLPVIGKKELSKEEKRKVSLTSQLIVITKIRVEYWTGTDKVIKLLNDYDKTSPNPQELYHFTVGAMQSVDSSVISDESFRSKFSYYLAKLKLFDLFFSPKVNVEKWHWDFTRANKLQVTMPSKVYLFYEGKYGTFPREGKPGKMGFSLIVREWTQAYRRYRKEKLNFENGENEEFKRQRQTEFLCGFFQVFLHLKTVPKPPVNSPLGKTVASASLSKPQSPNPPKPPLIPPGPNSQITNGKTPVQSGVDKTVNKGPPDGTLSDDNQSGASSKTVTETKDNIDTPVISNDSTLPHDLGHSQKVPKARCTSWGCILKTGLGIASAAGIFSAVYFWDDLIKRFFPTGNGTTPLNPNTTRPPTGPPSSPEIEGSSSTLWWILFIVLACSALLGLGYWKYYNSDDESSETETEEEVAKKKKKKRPKLKKRLKKEQPKVNMKKRVVRKKVAVRKGLVKKRMLPSSSSPVSKAIPSSVVSSSPQAKASPATLTSQTYTKFLAVQSPSRKAAANKAKRSTGKKKAKEKLKADVTNITECTTSTFPASEEQRNGSQTLAASTSPQTSTGALTSTPTWDAPTLQTTPALPSNAAAS